MTLALVAALGVALALAWSLAVMLDMACSVVAMGYRFIRREPGFRYCPDAIRSMQGAYRGHKKASRVAPARPSTHPAGTNQACAEVTKPASARYRSHGSRRWTG